MVGDQSAPVSTPPPSPPDHLPTDRQVRCRDARRAVTPSCPTRGRADGVASAVSAVAIQSEVTGIECTGRPVAAVVIAVYKSEGWG